MASAQGKYGGFMKEDETSDGKPQAAGHSFSPSADVIFYDLYGKPIKVVGYDLVGGVMKPRLDLQMLDDNAWQKAAIEQAHQLFFRDFHRVADNDEEAIAHHRRLAG